jgi:hypothetical protein
MSHNSRDSIRAELEVLALAAGGHSRFVECIYLSSLRTLNNGGFYVQSLAGHGERKRFRP